MKKIEKSIELGGRKLTLSTGHVAGQADGAVMVSYGETVVLATVVSANLAEDKGYFPLQVEYQERLYAGGRIKGSRWVKREGRPTDSEILTARLIDRSIRPLFPSTFKKEVQVIVTVLSVDLENSPNIPAGVAVSAALASSSIPWSGPVSILKVGLEGDKYILNPQEKQLETSQMELVVSTTTDAIVMIEAGAKQVSEDKILGGIAFAQKEGEALLKFIEDFAEKVGNKKEEVKEEKPSASLEKKVKEIAADKIKELIKDMSVRKVGYPEYDEVKAAVAESVSDEDRAQAKDIFEKLFISETRKMILSGKRPDGRKLDEIRDLSAEVAVLPRTHGSAIFNRGQTQVLTVATLGAHTLEQLIESAEGEESKRYIHHYSMLPYSSGETGKIGSPGRREIGHGALAERALLPVIPSESDFPYTIMVVTEVLSSNGSTSMAATCGSTLSLMDAGVPIKEPVAGIAMGLIVESAKEYRVLTDIAGIEDSSGDMDFKVAGTKDGITALQLDVKTLDLTHSILTDALKQAKKARDRVLKVITSTIDKPKPTVSKYAPKIKVIKIPQDKIGEVIGPGGKTIKRIIAETGAEIDVDDNGSVNISAIEEKSVEETINRIEALTKEVEAGEIYEGEVKRIQPFGAFVEVLPGKDGLVHISDMSDKFVQDPNEVVKIGDKVKVKVKEIDELGRINLTMNLTGKPKTQSGSRQLNRQQPRQSGGRPRRDNYSRAPRSRNRRDSQRQTFKGPHFPTSRYLDDKSKRYSR